MRPLLAAVVLLLTACGVPQGGSIGTVTPVNPMMAASDVPEENRSDAQTICVNEAATGTLIIREVCRSQDPDTEQLLQDRWRHRRLGDPAVGIRGAPRDPFQVSNRR
jgi:hypothetical protein